MNTDLGNNDYAVFQQAAGTKSVCLAPSLQLNEESTDPDVRSLLKNLGNSNAKVVVLFSEMDVTLRILQNAQTLGIAEKYFWVFATDFPGQIQNIPVGN